jgi:CRISPR type III-B/RAMP module RAMP protein Cmr1
MQFKVRFITPILIHGEDPRKSADQFSLGKALRGCWRFWFRTMVGGVIENIKIEDLHKFEGQIFGSSDENIGASFRMLVEPGTNLSNSETPIQFSQRNVLFHGFKEGTEFLIKILPRQNMKKNVKSEEILLSSIWLWANLGAVGQRARRGFGSPVIIEEDKCFKKLDLPTMKKLDNREQVETHLKTGLKTVWNKIKDWIESKNLKLTLRKDIATNNAPFNARYFILQSFKQIGVGKDSSKLNDVLQKVHGVRRCDDLGWAKGQNRMASPVFLRLYEADSKFYPVISWSEPKKDKTNCARKWLLNIGFKNYLSGDSI